MLSVGSRLGACELVAPPQPRYTTLPATTGTIHTA